MSVVINFSWLCPSFSFFTVLFLLCYKEDGANLETEKRLAHNTTLFYPECPQWLMPVTARFCDFMLRPLFPVITLFLSACPLFVRFRLDRRNVGRRLGKNKTIVMAFFFFFYCSSVCLVFYLSHLLFLLSVVLAVHILTHAASHTPELPALYNKISQHSLGAILSIVYASCHHHHHPLCPRH